MLKYEELKRLEIQTRGYVHITANRTVFFFIKNNREREKL
jgi:hypothetical protein